MVSGKKGRFGKSAFRRFLIRSFMRQCNNNSRCLLKVYNHKLINHLHHLDYSDKALASLKDFLGMLLVPLNRRCSKVKRRHLRYRSHSRRTSFLTACLSSCTISWTSNWLLKHPKRYSSLSATSMSWTNHAHIFCSRSWKVFKRNLDSQSQAKIWLSSLNWRGLNVKVYMEKDVLWS